MRKANMTRLDSLIGKDTDVVWSSSFVSNFSKKPKLSLIQKKITDFVMDVSQSKSIADSLETLSDASVPAPRHREAAATIITPLRSETSRVFQA